MSLAAAHVVSVNATGRIRAAPSASGSGIAVSAETVVNSGELHADGPSGGAIVIQANQMLNAGPISADARGGNGGQVDIAFRQSYMATAAAVVSASNAAGPGGQVTIDGETARDFDDAVHVSRQPNGHYQLQVHIADVAHYVEDGSAIDEEARKRGTSVYFPDRAVPMLPMELSTDLCSLRHRTKNAHPRQANTKGMTPLAGDESRDRWFLE